MSDHNHGSENFYKGLFFGALIGVGLAVFLNTETGKEVTKNVKKRIDEVLKSEIITDDYSEVTEEDVNSQAPKKTSPRRFFRKSK